MTEQKEFEKVEVEKIEAPTPPTEPQVDEALLKEYTEKYEKVKEENKKKVYGVDAEAVPAFLEYLENEVPWEYMEAFGIPKVYDMLVEEQKKGNKQVFLKGLELEALSFYVRKSKGVGLEKAVKFLTMRDALEPAYKLRQEDNKNETVLSQKVAAIEQGLSLDDSVQDEA